MLSIRKISRQGLALLLTMLLLQSCAVYVAYGLYRTISDIYDSFSGLMDELSDSIGEPLR